MRGLVRSFLPIGLALFSSMAYAEELSKAARANLLGGVVFIVALDDFGNGDLEPTSSGSGTVITKDGWIVTNFHVAFDYDTARPHKKLAIGFTKNPKERPEITCLADPDSGLFDRDLDIAVIKCDQDLQGKPLSSKISFNPVPIGDSETVDIGDEIYVIGYPGVGGETINFTSGKVSGFIGEDGKTAGDRWIKTEADLAPGNSGGACVNKKGELIGIPTQIHFGNDTKGGYVPKINLIRPTKYAKDFIDGSLKMKTITETVPVKLPKGEAPINPGKTPSGGVTLSGVLVASDNRKPISGATIIILKPGVKVSDVTKKNLGSLTYTKAVTTSNGEFKTDTPLKRNKIYAVIIEAKGFATREVDDGVEIGTDGDSVYNVGEVQLKRAK